MLSEVLNISARRVNPVTGTLEYRVHWADGDAFHSEEEEEDADVVNDFSLETISFHHDHSTWQSRASLVPYCADLIDRVDWMVLEALDKEVLEWRRVRGAATSPPLLPTSSSHTEAHPHEKQRSPLSASAPNREETTEEVEHLNAIVWQKGGLTASERSRQFVSTGGRPPPPMADARRGAEAESTPSSFNDTVRQMTESATEEVVLLGEVFLKDEVSEVLNPAAPHLRRQLRAGKRRRATEEALEGERCSTETLCAASQQMEKTWKEIFTKGFLYSCVACEEVSSLGPVPRPARRVSTSTAQEVPEEDDSALSQSPLSPSGAPWWIRVVDLAPLLFSEQATQSNYAAPFSLLSLVGSHEAERLRRISGYAGSQSPSYANDAGMLLQESLSGTHSSVVQDLLRERSEQMVVRCFLHASIFDTVEASLVAVPTSVPDASPAPRAKEGDADPWRRKPLEEKMLEEDPYGVASSELRMIHSNWKLVSIPLTVFRMTFPQLLLDYLLEHTLVFETG